MVKYKSSDLLRDQAKIKLDGKFSSALRILLLGQLILSLVNYGVTDILNVTGLSGGISGYVISLLLSLILTIILGAFQIGYAYFFLNAYCGEPYHISDILYGFQNRPSVAISLTAIFSIANFLMVEPVRLLLNLAINAGSTLYLSYAFLWGTFALVVSVYVWLRFHLALYLFLDFPEKSFEELLRLSSQLMKGHKLRLLYLRLSFIPLLLLGICSCGIGFLWINPYIAMTDVCFFMDLMNPGEA